MPLLDIKNLSIEIDTPNGRVRAVDNVNLTLAEGEVRALVGESGSGKSLVGKAIIGVTKENWYISADRFRLGNIDLLKLSATQRRKIIGREIAMIFQEPKQSLDPSDTIGEQLRQSIPDRDFTGFWWQKRKWRNNEAINFLHRVGIKDHSSIMHSYPSELTNGECQKVMVAMALARRPRLLIADEPTAELDSINQAQIFRIMGRMNQLNNTTILFISHDLNTVTSWADRITVMYCGQAIESGNREQLLERTCHPYTQALLNSMPDFTEDIQPKSRLATLPGTIPSLQHLPIGCRLGPRCPYAQRKCVKTPSQKYDEREHIYYCHYPLGVNGTTNTKGER